MRVVMIVNPVAGRRAVDAIAGDVAARLRGRDCDVDVRWTAGAGDAVAIAGDVADEADVVVTVGGDGTVSDVVAGLNGRLVPVVIVPAGTENLLAIELGMSREPAGIVETVIAGRRRVHDVGVANGRSFLMMAGIGWDGEAVARLAERRRGHISHWSYFGPLWRTFWGYRFPAVRVEADGAVVFDGRGLVFVGVLPCYALGLRVVRDAIADDGLLDVCVLPCSTRRGLIGHAVRVLRGRHVGRNDVIYLRAKILWVSSDEVVRMQCDGDASGALPVAFSVRARSAVFQVPPADR